MTKDQWERFTLFTSELLFRYKKTKLITQKTDERIPNPTFCVLSWKMDYLWDSVVHSLDIICMGYKFNKFLLIKDLSSWLMF